MTIIVKAFTDIISCDPHNNPVRYGGQELPPEEEPEFGGS